MTDFVWREHVLPGNLGSESTYYVYATTHVKICEDLEKRIRELEAELIETRQQRDKAEYDRTYAIGAIKTLLRELGETGSPLSDSCEP